MEAAFLWGYGSCYIHTKETEKTIFRKHIPSEKMSIPSNDVSVGNRADDVCASKLKIKKIAAIP
ncbi:MAG: hypothetical protein B7C24_09450 [Bacteroidetes bacterium 4572_77]|nr:MAG: hypothetical protein B7C24_09450 [Bacteroidetes bacterium 4572_77]